MQNLHTNQDTPITLGGTRRSGKKQQALDPGTKPYKDEILEDEDDEQSSKLGQKILIKRNYFPNPKPAHTRRQMHKGSRGKGSGV